MNLRSISNMMLGLAIVAFTATGCKKYEWKDKNCGSGSCVDDNCVCDTGYERSECGTQTRAKFVGNHSGTFSCSGGIAGHHQHDRFEQLGRDHQGGDDRWLR